MPYLLVVVGVIGRVLPHAWNFTPVGGMGLYAGAYYNWRVALALPLVTLFIGDLFLGFYGFTGMFFTYLGFLAGPLVGRWLLAKRRSLARFGGAVFIAATLHFLISNIGSWFALYPQTLQGLIDCYVMAIPFYWSTLLGDALYAGIFFGIHELIQRYREQTDGAASA